MPRTVKTVNIVHMTCKFEPMRVLQRHKTATFYSGDWVAALLYHSVFSGVFISSVCPLIYPVIVYVCVVFDA